MIRTATPHDAQAIARINAVAREAAMPWLPVVHTPDEDFHYFATIVLVRDPFRTAA